jgi:hypothetical protein
MARTSQAEDLRASLDGIGRILRRLVSHKGWSFSRRRIMLFELWDECAEWQSADDRAAAAEPLARAGEEARRIIEHFIRHHLPANSTEAYRADELSAFNARRQSRQSFNPYEEQSSPVR